MEYKVEIGGVTYYMSALFSISITRPLFEKLSVGNTCAAELKVSFYPSGEVARMAKIIPYARKASDDDWSQLGVFYTDTRAKDGKKLELTAYDAMLKAEQTYLQSDDVGEWPRTMATVVSEICARMGVTLDSRTALKSYTVDYPNDLTMREVLGYIAAAHGGNWIITAEGKLLLVPLFSSMPEETFFLVDEDGDRITFGGDRIIL